MKSYSFTPFTGTLQSFRASELSKLTQVSEGWYIDYKQEPPSTKDLARHLTAFANQHGGWLFIGISENKAGMTAKDFPGIPNDVVGGALVQLRDAAAHHSHPPLFFEHRVLTGPISELDLPENRSLVVVGIPKSEETPHVHSSGKIYRRQADQSDPKEETDRHVLDRLWERRIQARERLAAFLSSKPEMSEGEARFPYLFLYLLPSRIPFELFDASLRLDQFTQVMKDSHEWPISTKFSTIFPTADGYVAREPHPIRPELEGLTFRWWHNGTARVTIPINILRQQKGSTPYPTYDEFLEMVQVRGFDTNIADFSLCSTSLVAYVGKYLGLRAKAGYSGAFYGKVWLSGAWRMIPFLNTRSYIPYIKDQGIPLIQENSLYAWPGVSPESLIELGSGATLPNDDDPRSMTLLTAFPLAGAILWAVGIGSLAQINNPLTANEFTAAMVEAASLHLA